MADDMDSIRNRAFLLETSFCPRINLKPAILKNRVFDWEVCFDSREVYRFQNLVGLELSIKHTLKLWAFYTTNQITIFANCDGDSKYDETLDSTEQLIIFGKIREHDSRFEDVIRGWRP